MGENTIIVSQSTNNMVIFLLLKLNFFMKSLKAIRMIKSLNCNLILCATEFLKHRKMGHTIIAAVKKIEQRIK